MKIKPSTGTSLTNKKTTPPTVGKISKPKRFKGKSKTSGSKLTSTPKTPKGGKKELSALKSSSQKNKKISPELNLGLKIEKILENGGPNVIRLNSESETPKTSLAKKKKLINEGTEVQNLKKKVKRTKKEDTDASELSDKSKSPTPKQKKKINSTDRTGGHEIHSQQEGKKKVKLNKNQLPQSKNKLETEPSSSDAVCQSNEEIDEDSEEKEKHVYSWDVPSQFNLDHDKNTDNESREETELIDNVQEGNNEDTFWPAKIAICQKKN